MRVVTELPKGREKNIQTGKNGGKIQILFIEFLLRTVLMY